MLRHLRDPTGRPTTRVRVIAVLAAIGLIALAAPAIIPLVSWLADLFW